MRQVACNATFEGIGRLNGRRYLLHDRDAKFCAEFRETLAAGGVKCLRLPPRSPNLNAFAERWVRSVKEECLSHLILFGERSLRKALIQFQEHYHEERNHQGKSNVLLFPPLLRLSPVGDVASAVENASAAYSDTTVAPHEYFYRRGFLVIQNPGLTCPLLASSSANCHMAVKWGFRKMTTPGRRRPHRKPLLR